MYMKSFHIHKGNGIRFVLNNVRLLMKSTLTLSSCFHHRLIIPPPWQGKPSNLIFRWPLPGEVLNPWHATQSSSQLAAQETAISGSFHFHHRRKHGSHGTALSATILWGPDWVAAAYGVQTSTPSAWTKAERLELDSRSLCFKVHTHRLRL